MQQKLLRNLSKVLATKKRHYMGDLPSRTKIEKIKKKKNYLLPWCQNLEQVSRP